MKLTTTCLIALAIAQKPRSWGEEVNGDACMYYEVDGVTTVTTVEKLMITTKCFKKFSCDDGRNVMARVNKMALGTYNIGPEYCQNNFVKFEYHVPREGNTDYQIEDTYCYAWQPDLELGKWMTLDDHVWFSFVFEKVAFYEFFYGNIDDYDLPYDLKPKFEIEFKCWEPVETEPATTPSYFTTSAHTNTTITTTTTSTTTTTTTTEPKPIGNQAYERLDTARNSWEEMITKSSMRIRAKTRTQKRFNTLCDRLETRHEELIAAGCSFQAMNEINFDAVFIQYNDTCTTTDKLIQGMKFLLFMSHKLCDTILSN